MTKTDLGKKWTCDGCGARFSDLHRDPPTCPKCGTGIGARATRIKPGDGPPAPDSQAGAAAGEPEDLAALALDEEEKIGEVAEQDADTLIEDVRDMSMDTGEQEEVPEEGEDKAGEEA